MESCPAKTVISGGMGFALGGVFGLFMASVGFSLSLFPSFHFSPSPSTLHTYIDTPPPPPPLSPSHNPKKTHNTRIESSQMRYDTPLTAQGAELSSLPIREQFRRGIKDMGKASFSSAKNFGLVGAIFAGTECCIEGVRQLSLFSLSLSPSKHHRSISSHLFYLSI